MGKPKSSAKRGMSMEEKVQKVDQWFQQHPVPYLLKELTISIPKATGVVYQSIEEVLETLVSEYRVCEEKVGVHTLYWCFPPTETQKQLKLLHPEQGNSSSRATTTTSISTPPIPTEATYASLSRRELEASHAQLQKHLIEAQEKTALQAASIGFSSLEALAESEEGKTLQEAEARYETLHRRHQERLQKVSEEAYQQRCQASRHRQGLQQQLLQAVCTVGLCRSIRDSIRVALTAANRWTDNFMLVEEEVLRRAPGMTTREVRQRLGCPVELDVLSMEEMQEWMVDEGKEPQQPDQKGELSPAPSVAASTADFCIQSKQQQPVPEPASVEVVPQSTPPSEKKATAATNRKTHRRTEGEAVVATSPAAAIHQHSSLQPEDTGSGNPSEEASSHDSAVKHEEEKLPPVTPSGKRGRKRGAAAAASLEDEKKEAGTTTKKRRKY